MNKRTTFTVLIAIVVSLLLTTAALAANSKYTFNDVNIDGTVVEIEAAVKDNKKSDFSSCTYYSDDYQEWLGQYQDDVDAGDTAEDVLDFCVDHFDDRSQ